MFLLGRHLAKRLAGTGHEEDWVVAKTRLAAPLGHDLTATLALEELGVAIRRRECDHAHKPRPPRPRHPIQAAQKSRRPFLLGRSEARRTDPRKSTKRVELDAGVIAYRG